jgi:hypothetical protein
VTSEVEIVTAAAAAAVDVCSEQKNSNHCSNINFILLSFNFITHCSQ